MNIVSIKAADIHLPDGVPKAPGRIIQVMADDLATEGWPIGKELEVRRVSGGFVVVSDYSLFSAAKLAGIVDIPCVLVG
jgi:hypothetical protein